LRGDDYDDNGDEAKLYQVEYVVEIVEQFSQLYLGEDGFLSLLLAWSFLNSSQEI